MAEQEQNSSNKKAVVTGDLPIDWTKLNTAGSNGANPQERIRYPTDVMEYSNDPEETYLEIIGTAGQKITHMGKDFYRTCSPNLTHLILRSHLITKMEGVRDFRKLELLELYDNQVQSLEELEVEEDGDEGSISCGATLTTLDMSYNAIRDMEPVHFCPNLVDLCKFENRFEVSLVTFS